jgi:hypothetical protein
MKNKILVWNTKLCILKIQSIAGHLKIFLNVSENFSFVVKGWISNNITSIYARF